MPSTADAFRQPAEYISEAGMLLRQPFGGITDRRGEQQFAAGRRPEPSGSRLQAALVGDPEVPDLFDGVAEELDPQRMFLNGREDVEYAPAYGDIAAVLDQVGARVTGLDEPGEHLFEVGLVSWPKPDRLDVAESGHDGLEEAANRRDDDLERPGGRAGVFRFHAPVSYALGRCGIRVRQPAEHGKPLADSVRTWREPFVRERLPCGEARHRVSSKQRAQCGRQVLGLTAGGGDSEDETRRGGGCARAAAAGRRAVEAVRRTVQAVTRTVQVRRAVQAAGKRERGSDERPQRCRCDDVSALLVGMLKIPARAARVFEGAAKLGVVGDDAEKSSKAHDFR